MATIRRRDGTRSLRRKDGLVRFSEDVTSQNGEDGIVKRLFELILHGDAGNENDNHIRYLVDVGAWDGKHLSNTYSLLTGEGNWKGVLIEADSERFEELEKLHKGRGNMCVRRRVSCVKGSIGSLEHILDESGPLIGMPLDFEFLCIDIDGVDYWVLSNLLQSPWKPKVICIEFNPTMPNDLIYIPPQDDDVRHGASLSALVELVKSHSLVLVETTIFNAFFVRAELYETYLKETVPDTSIEALHEVTMGSTLYQLYDGTLKLNGCKKLLWHRLPIEEEKIQVLPPSQRRFPFAPENDDDIFDAASVVDISSYCCSDVARQSGSTERTTEQMKCSSGLLHHLRRDGFCYVRGTGISATECRDALRMTNAFLHDADENVRRACLAKDRARRGYSPMATENFACLIGESGPNDLVRKFRVGPCGAESVSNSNCVMKRSEKSSLLQPNIWPGDNWTLSADFRNSIEVYYHSVCRAAQAVLVAICEGLVADHPQLKRSLDPLCKRGSLELTDQSSCPSSPSSSILTLLGYRVGSRHKGKNKGPLVAAHTDVGVITLLLFDSGNCATLQRAHEKGWHDVALPKLITEDPIFVVNVADCLSELSGDRLPSTLHRVIAANPNGGTSRNCCALFVGLDPNEELYLVDGRTLSYEEWRKHRIARAQKVLETGANGKDSYGAK